MQIVVMAGGANDFVLPDPMPMDDYVAAGLTFLEQVLLGPLSRLSAAQLYAVNCDQS